MKAYIAIITLFMLWAIAPYGIAQDVQCGAPPLCDEYDYGPETLPSACNLNCAIGLICCPGCDKWICTAPKCFPLPCPAPTPGPAPPPGPSNCKVDKDCNQGEACCNGCQNNTICLQKPQQS